ncbi:MAG: hypothetical protein P9X27_02360 [Candidatus Kaelpia aquatica]|nr:hypothetical protein [Candidatus Kaelpia aquatica]
MKKLAIVLVVVGLVVSVLNLAIAAVLSPPIENITSVLANKDVPMREAVIQGRDELEDSLQNIVRMAGKEHQIRGASGLFGELALNPIMDLLNTYGLEEMISSGEVVSTITETCDKEGNKIFRNELRIGDDIKLTVEAIGHLVFYEGSGWNWANGEVTSVTLEEAVERGDRDFVSTLKIRFDEYVAVKHAGILTGTLVVRYMNPGGSSFDFFESGQIETYQDKFAIMPE